MISNIVTICMPISVQDIFKKIILAIFENSITGLLYFNSEDYSSFLNGYCISYISNPPYLWQCLLFCALFKMMTILMSVR